MDMTYRGREHPSLGRLPCVVMTLYYIYSYHVCQLESAVS